jgi:hypothetical protein
MSEEQIAPYDFNASTSRDWPPELSPEPFDRRPLFIGIGVVVVFLALFAGLTWWLFVHPDTAETIRDIAIIYIAVGLLVLIPMVIILIVIAAYLLLKINDVVRLLDREIRPMLSNIQETLNSVKGTTTFISEEAAKPVIKTASTVYGVNAIVKALFRRN